MALGRKNHAISGPLLPARGYVDRLLRRLRPGRFRGARRHEALPSYNESFKVRAALEAIASQPDIAQKTAHEIRTLVMRNFEFSDVDRFTDATIKNALSVKRDPSGRQRVVRMAYEAPGPLFGNLDVVLKIDESITIAGAATE